MSSAKVKNALSCIYIPPYMFKAQDKYMHENQQTHQLFIQFIMYGSSFMF